MFSVEDPTVKVDGIAKRPLPSPVALISRRIEMQDAEMWSSGSEIGGMSSDIPPSLTSTLFDSPSPLMLSHDGCKTAATGKEPCSPGQSGLMDLRGDQVCLKDASPRSWKA